MKITPLAVWGQNLDSEELVSAVTADVTMIHSNVRVAHYTSAYVLAIKHLLNNPEQNDRGQKAFEIALEFENASSDK